MFRFYVEHWAFGSYSSWEEFSARGKRLLGKPVPGKDALLASNLMTILGAIRERFAARPKIEDVLLYLHHAMGAEQLPQKTSEGFTLVPVDYSGATLGNFVRL